MSMTKQERIAKNEVMKQLGKEGYPTYANLLDLFDVNLTRNPNIAAAMEPGKARILLNRGLDIEQVSVLVRHEILHEYLNHHQRLLKHLAKSKGLNFDELDDMSIKDVERELNNTRIGPYTVGNYAGDYEISNRGYTDRDKATVRSIKLNGQILKGLVTEDDHPDWVDLSIEELFDKIMEERKKDMEDAKNQQQQQQKQGDQDQQGQGQGEGGSSFGGGGQSQDQDDDSDSDSNGDSGGDSDNQQQGKQKGKGGKSSSSDDNDSTGDMGDAQDDASKEFTDNEDSVRDISDKLDKLKDKMDNGELTEEDINDIIDELKDALDDIEKKLKDNPSTPQETLEELEELKKALDEIKKQAKDASSKNKESGKKGDSGGDKPDGESGQAGGMDGSADGRKASDILKDDSIADRIKEIKQAFEDVQSQENALSEIEANVQKERAAKSARDLERYRNSDAYRFKMNLNKFIKREIEVDRGSDRKKFNKTYAHSSLIKPGRATIESENIPSINVYFDRSGSWDEAKTKVGAEAIATLNNYVRKGQLKINLYYFAINVHGVEEDAIREGGTDGQPIMDHIRKTKPDNVVIMTDADITDITEGVIVPGAVWLVFKGGQSRNLIDNIHGKKETKIYDLT